MANLNELTKNKLIELIQNFGAANRIFHCEAQFQFELAWEIQKIFENSGIQVYLESRKNIENLENRTAKRYTDIVVQDTDNNYIAIELKYKTKEGKGIYSSLKTHAAQDLGRYDFLWDTCRNEQLIRSKDNRLGVCIKGFSIILTNDNCYWEKSGEHYMYEQFSLQNNRAIPSNQFLEWDCKERNEKQMINSVGKARMGKNINLSGKYICTWLPYYANTQNSVFQFLIFESSKN